MGREWDLDVNTFRNKDSGHKCSVSFIRPHSRCPQLRHSCRKVSKNHMDTYERLELVAGSISQPGLLAPQRGHSTKGQALALKHQGMTAPDQPHTLVKWSSLKQTSPEVQSKCCHTKAIAPGSFLTSTHIAPLLLSFSGSSEASPPGVGRAELSHRA